MDFSAIILIVRYRLSVTEIGWLFTLGTLLHNAEEAVWLPAWSQRVRRISKPVAASVFRLAVGVVSILFVAITCAASFSQPEGIAAYLMAGYVLTMVMNVFFPHTLASFVTRSYMPGTATAILFNLPLGLFYLLHAITGGYIALPTFYWAGPAVILGFLALLPALFAIGRRLTAGN